MTERSREENGHNTTAVTVRLEDDLLKVLNGLAMVDETSLAGVLRTAATQYADVRQADPEFPQLVEAAKARQLASLAIFETE